jgi:uncharacterized integral membrane protein
MQGERPHEKGQDHDRSGEPRDERGGAHHQAEARQEGQEKAKPSQWELAQRKRRRGFTVRLVLGVAILVLFVIFVSLNSESVTVDFIFIEGETSLVLVFLICAMVGALVAYLLGRSERRASRKYIKELENRLEKRGDFKN